MATKQIKAEALSSFPMGRTTTQCHSGCRESREKGIVITTIGAGTEKGALIPEQDDLGFKYKLDEEGQPVRSKLNKEELIKIAAAAHGRYYSLDNPRSALEGVKNMVDNLDKGTYDVHETSNNISLFPWLLWPAFFLFLIEMIMSMNN
ncbi:MAG: hypothetical protein HWD63_00235 [Candidatus Parvibacillus calidus]|nr:MAG: hypothetical protein HWD63_00235 [Candidatus Parvibacillus calidus]